MAKYGIYEKALLPDKLEDSLNFAKEAGYEYWEISVDKERKDRLSWSNETIDSLLDICKKNSMPIFNMVLSIHRDFPLGSKDESIRMQGIEYLKQAIVLAGKLNIRTIQLAGYYTSGNGKADGSIELYIESLKKCVNVAAERGVLLGIENMDRDLIDSKDILYIIKKVDNPYLKMFLDVGNFAANNLNVIEQLQIGLPHLVGLHLKETRLGEYRRVLFGQGIVDFSAIFKFLSQENYDGYFGVEMWNDNNSDSLSIVKSSLKWLISK